MIRTKTTKMAETMAFQKLSTMSILIGASKELWKRHSEWFWIIGFWVFLVLLIWVKYFN